MFKFAFLLIGMWTTSVHANTLTVEAFHDQTTRLLNVQMAERIANVTVYDLSAPERFEKALSEGLSSDPAEAERQAKERIVKRGHVIQQELMQAYEGSLKAMQYNVEKVPAVVFNAGQYIIYGVSDIDKAIKLYNERVAQ